MFPRKKRNPRYLNGCPPGTLDLITDSGWISSDSFLEWLRFFVKSVRPSADGKCLLILDNHASHRAIDVLDYAYENNVVLLTVPPHSTHKLQPLDVSVYGPFGKYFQLSIDRWQKAHPSQHVSFFDIGEIFSEAYLKAATPANAISGFRKTGILDCNKDVFTDLDFMPSQVTEIEDHNTTLENQLTFTKSTKISRNVEDIQDGTSTIQNIGDTTSNQNDENGAATSEFVQRDQDGSSSSSCVQNINNNDSFVSFEDDNRPSVSNYVTNKHSDEVGNGTQKEKVQLSDLRPLPKCQKRENKRKTQKSEVLTSTPVKEELRKQAQNSQKKSTVKRQISGSSQPPALIMPKKSKQISSPEESKVPCLLCGDTFGNSVSGEKWIQCNICQLWAHKLCTDYKTGVFICDNCQQEVILSRKSV